MDELPRSIRWRLQLGTYNLPDGDDWDLGDFVKSNRTRNWLQRSKYEKLEKEYGQELSAACHFSGGSCAMDPLSVFAMEAEAKERRQVRVRQSNQTSTTKTLTSASASASKSSLYDDASGSLAYHSSGSELSENSDADKQDIEEIISTIKKDLNRLHPEHNEIFHEYMHKTYESSEDDTSDQRHALLEEVLYIFAREHPHFSYQQGMHELASIMLCVIEMDVYDEDRSQLLGNFLDYRYIAHDAYALIEALFARVGPAFSGDSLDVVSKIRFVSGDDKFLRYIVAMDVDPELYCARWIRLLFSREVTHWKRVLPLMDLFMDLTSEHPTVLSFRNPSAYTRPGMTPVLVPGKMEWLTVLETAAASLIWMQRSELLKREPDDGFYHLVNMPKMESVSGLMSTLLSTIRRLQHNHRPHRTNIEGLNVEDCEQMNRARSVSPGPGAHRHGHRHHHGHRRRAVSKSPAPTPGHHTLPPNRSLSTRQLGGGCGAAATGRGSSSFLSSSRCDSRERAGQQQQFMNRVAQLQHQPSSRTLLAGQSPLRRGNSFRSLVSTRSRSNSNNGNSDNNNGSWSIASPRRELTPTERRRRTDFARQGSAADLYDALTGMVSSVKLPSLSISSS